MIPIEEIDDDDSGMSERERDREESERSSSVGKGDPPAASKEPKRKGRKPLNEVEKAASAKRRLDKRTEEKERKKKLVCGRSRSESILRLSLISFVLLFFLLFFFFF